MKKYLFGLFAVALAVAFSAFTAPSKKINSLNPIKFEYHGDDESGFAVEQNWVKQDVDFDITCPASAPTLACRVFVDISGVDTPFELSQELSGVESQTELEGVTGISIDTYKDEQ